MGKRKTMPPIAIGQRYGRWTVLREAPKRKHRSMWTCRCACGTIKDVLAQNLMYGRSLSCGCYARDVHWRGCGELCATYWSRLRGDAKQRGLLFDIDIEYGWDLYLKQNRRCALTGVELRFARSTREYWARYTTASVDRIDSTKPYVIGNVQWVHKTINKMKQNLSEEEFLRWAKLLADYEQTKASK